MTHLSLSQLNGVIRKCLEKNLEGTYWVVAEIAEIRLHPKGHCYLELVEKEQENILARMKATIWSYTYETWGADRLGSSRVERQRPGRRSAFDECPLGAGRPKANCEELA